MLPRLTTIPQLNPTVEKYLELLKEQSFCGDIATNYGDRLSLATDNSVYQMLPQAILFPKDLADIVRITKLASKAEFQSLTFTPRGGGTGTNGQSLNDNIIVDMSRHMTNILEINVKERWVKVQAGVVKDQLNQFLKPFGLFFAPELSTSNRATIGGMINTDASGQGSLKYGKTSDHILGLRSVLINGEVLETEGIANQNFAVNLANQALTPTGRELHTKVWQKCYDYRPQILQDLPQLNRFLTGYDLKNVFNNEETVFNLSRILTGSEGTLAFICEAKLNVLPIPKYRTLINIKYRSFQDALRNAPFLVQANALSVETVDSKVLNLAKQDIIWHSVQNLLTESQENPILGLNIVEFSGNNKKNQNEEVKSLCRQLDQAMAQQQAGIIGYQLCEDLDSINKIYAMRKKAVGLLGNSQGSAKPIPFVEDTCVPPEHLADYIQEFRQLLDQHQLQYGMFGHVDAGVLHVRPALDLCDKKQVLLFKQISDQVADLTKKYGGLIWGEHGKGVRSEYSEKYFTPELWQLLREIKGWFDPHNRLNPGKICPPLSCSQPLKSILSPIRADQDRQIPIAVKDNFKGALNCNGNGLCFNFDVHSTMCPSMKVSHNRLFSPKGRAGIIREWLRLMEQAKVDPEKLTTIEKQVSLGKMVLKIKNSWLKANGQYDFSHEVKEAMDTCLACKACASQCPIKIDVPRFRSKFFYLYHQRYAHPLKDYVVANVEKVAPLMAKVPVFFNFFTQQKVTAKLAGKVLGMRDLPLLSVPTLSQQLLHQGYQEIELDKLKCLTKEQKKNYLLVVQDPFTSYFDAQVVADFVKLSQKLGFKPIVLPFKPNGKAQHIKGFLPEFRKTAEKQGAFLNDIAKLGIAMVGVDPAIVLSYRDEYAEILAEKRGDFKVLNVHEWLLTHLENVSLNIHLNPEDTGIDWHLFAHCTESTALPNSTKEWQQIFHIFQQELIVESVGCCGMAGTFGHETQHFAMSKAIFDSSWQKKLQDKNLAHCLATGYSCRSQVKRFEQQQLKHPLQALLGLLA